MPHIGICKLQTRETDNQMAESLQEDSGLETSRDCPAISLIVPVYNTAAFLPRCLDSLAAQVFSDFELILVDDGSTDQSLSVLEAYTKRFVCASIIHQENQGLSAARNVGIRASKGAYLAFVDSDDWVAPSFLQSLYSMIVGTQSDISQIAALSTVQPREIKQAPEKQRVLSSLEALAEMFETEEYSVCMRLYARSLFDDPEGSETFPIGLTCEDRVANFKLISKAQRIVVSNKIEYFYFQNLGSISFGALSRRSLDLLAADALVLEMAEAYGDISIYDWAADRSAKGAYSLLVKWARFGITEAALDEKAVLSKLRKRFRADYPRLMASKLSFAKKLVAWQLRYLPRLLKAEFRLLALIGPKHRKAVVQ